MKTWDVERGREREREREAVPREEHRDRCAKGSRFERITGKGSREKGRIGWRRKDQKGGMEGRKRGIARLA